MFKKTALLTAIAGLALVTTSANAATILVVDALATGQARGAVPNYGANPTSTTFDFSTGGDSAAGLTGTVALSGVTTGYYEPTLALSRQFNTGSATYISNGTATWTVTGYAPGATVDVFAYWGGFATVSDAVSYSVNGVALGTTKSHKVASAADLVLADPDGTGANFESFGSFTADGSGQVQVVLTSPGGFAFVDAIAFSSAIPEPGSLALMGLGGLLIGARRRRA